MRHLHGNLPDTKSEPNEIHGHPDLGAEAPSQRLGGSQRLPRHRSLSRQRLGWMETGSSDQHAGQTLYQSEAATGLRRQPPDGEIEASIEHWVQKLRGLCGRVSDVAIDEQIDVGGRSPIQRSIERVALPDSPAGTEHRRACGNGLLGGPIG
jgi:hypothetical protein